MDTKKALKTAKAQAEEKETLLKAGVKKAVGQYISLKKDFDSKIEFYKANAQEIIKRRTELGEDYAKDLSDEEILNDDKFALAKAQKENLLLKASKESTSENVGTKGQDKDDIWYSKRRKEIDKKAFGDKKE